MTDTGSATLFEQSVTIALDREFDATKNSAWRAAVPSAWSMTLLLAQLEPTHTIERVLRATKAGQTLALLTGATRSLAAEPTVACSTLTDGCALPLTRVLVAIGAPRARSRTLRVAARLAAHTGAALFGVHCVDETVAAQRKGAVVAANARVAAQGDARVAFEAMRVEPTTNATAAIEAAAREFHAGLIVVGKRSPRSQLAIALSQSRAFSTLAVA